MLQLDIGTNRQQVVYLRKKIGQHPGMDISTVTEIYPEKGGSLKVPEVRNWKPRTEDAFHQK
jgi:hypothetical protein